jgi:hypothetical protein
MEIYSERNRYELKLDAWRERCRVPKVGGITPL